MENNKIEYKREIGSDIQNTIIKPIIAFANTFGGKILLGYDDNGKFYKKQSKEDKERIINAIMDSINDDPEKVNIKIKFNSNGGIIIEVPESKSAWFHKINNKCYERQNASSVEVDISIVQNRKNEIRSTYEKYDSEKFKLLNNFTNGKFDKSTKRKAYYLSDKDDDITILGSFFKDSGKIIKINGKDFSLGQRNEIIAESIKYIDIQFLHNSIEKTSIKKLINNVEIIIRELVANAISHTAKMNTVEIGTNDFGLITCNNINSNSEFRNMIKKNQFIHWSNNLPRLKLFKELKIIESESQGYNDIIQANPNYEILFAFDNEKIYIWLIFTPLIKSKYNVESIYGINNIDDIKTIIPNVKFAKHFFKTTQKKAFIKKDIMKLGE